MRLTSAILRIYLRRKFYHRKAPPHVDRSPCGRLQRVLHSCLSSRVLFNLRAARQRELQISLNTIALRSVQFAAPPGENTNVTQIDDNLEIEEVPSLPSRSDRSHDEEAMAVDGRSCR